MARAVLDRRAMRAPGAVAIPLVLVLVACTGGLGDPSLDDGSGGVDPGAHPPSPGGSPSGSDPPPAPTGGATVSGGCIITGCNDQLCSDHLITTDCQEQAQDACFHSAICERNAEENCGWRPTADLNGCLARAAGQPPPNGTEGAGTTGSGSGRGAEDGGTRDDERTPSGGGGTGTPLPGGGGEPATGECRQTGCFGEVCADRDLMPPSCSWSNEYACNYASTCELQSDGSCGW